MPRLAVVVLSETCRGKGIEDDPMRTVVQVFNTDGELIAERDDWSLENSARLIADANAAIHKLQKELDRKERENR